MVVGAVWSLDDEWSLVVDGGWLLVGFLLSLLLLLVGCWAMVTVVG